MILNLLFVLAVHLVVWGMARRSRSLDGLLLLRGASVVSVAVLSLPAAKGGGLRAVVIALLAIGWGLRLALHHYVRERFLGPERALREWAGTHGARWHAVALGRLVLPQVGLLWLCTSTIQHGIIHGVDLSVSALDGAGVGLVGLGLAVEAAADRQLLLFRQLDGAGDGVLDSGLWAWSRHPNHLGSLLAVWGFYLLVASAGGGLWGLVGTLTATAWFGGVAGRIQEAGICARRPAYSEYAGCVSRVLPGAQRTPRPVKMPESALKFLDPVPSEGDDTPPKASA